MGTSTTALTLSPVEISSFSTGLSLLRIWILMSHVDNYKCLPSEIKGKCNYVLQQVTTLHIRQFIGMKTFNSVMRVFKCQTV